MKKLFALVLVMALCFSLAIPAFAAGSTYDLFIKNSVAGHTYEAYQIFQGDLSVDEATLSNVEWGESIANAAGLVDALTTDTYPIETTSGTVTLGSLFSVLTTTAPDKQAEKLAELLGTVSNDSVTLDRFAEIVGAYNYGTGEHLYLDDPVGTVNTQTSKDIDGVTVSGYNLELPMGYYLVKDQEGTQNGVEGGYYTKYIVRLIRSADLSPKGSGVTVDKGINDTVDGTFSDVEDFDVADIAYYKWEGTLPINLNAYDEYAYKFIDKLPKYLTFEKLEQVYIESHEGVRLHTFMDVTNTETTDDALPAGITLTVTPDSDAMVKLINGETVGGKTLADVPGQTITLAYDDLLDLYPNLLSTQKIIVKYSAKVNKEALISSGSDSNPMVNEVYVEYDNNPNGEGTGKTLPSKAYAFSFKYTVDKYDMADPTKKLENVKFLMYCQRIEGGVLVKYYAKVVTEEMVALGDLVEGKKMDNEDVGLVYGWTTDRAQAAVLDTDANGAFTIHGLDEGTYYLEETETNSGYNLLDTPVQIVIDPDYTVGTDTASVSVEYFVDSITQGSNDVVGVRNSKGATLPSTGGTGTTVFYIAGGILVAAAVVLLVTKKRMGEEA